MIGILLTVAIVGGVYEITYSHETARGARLSYTLEASSIADAISKADNYGFYKITKVEEINPMPKVHEVQAIIDKAKLLQAALKKYETKRERAGSAAADKSAKIAAELATDCHHLEALEASLHAACVDAGVADVRDPSEYEERSWWLSEFHEQRWKPEAPKRLPAVR